MKPRQSFFASAELIASMNKANALAYFDDEISTDQLQKNRSESVEQITNMRDMGCPGNADYHGRHDLFYNSIYAEFVKEYCMKENETGTEYSELLELNPKFNWISFFEFLFYHTMQLFIMGPLFGLGLSIFPRYRSLMRNMNFFPGLNRYYFAYLIIYMSNVCVLISLFEGNHFLLTEQERYICLAMNMFTAFIISFNYAVLSTEKIRYLKKRLINERIFKRENMMGDWATHKDEKVYQEIINAVRRLEIDLSLFYCNFAIDPSASLRKRLALNLSRLSKEHKRKSFTFQPLCLAEDDSCIMIFGYSLFYEMLKAFRKKERKPLLIRILYTFIVWRFCFTPFFFLWNQKNPLACASNLDIATLILSELTINLFCFVILLHLSIYCVDMMRTLHCLIQLTYLQISQKQEQEFKDVKLFPTLNIFCQMNMKCWMSLRKLVMSYGCKYHIIGDKALMLGCVVLLKCLILIVLHALDVNELSVRELILMSFDFLAFGAILFTLFFVGAFINDHFRIHINTLDKNKNICADLQKLAVYYFDHKSRPENFHYERGVYVMRKHYGDDLNRISKHLSDVIGITECGINDLKNEEQNNPFQVFGLPISSVMIRNILVALGPVLVAVAQSLIKKWTS